MIEQCVNGEVCSIIEFSRSSSSRLSPQELRETKLLTLERCPRYRSNLLGRALRRNSKHSRGSRR